MWVPAASAGLLWPFAGAALCVLIGAVPSSDAWASFSSQTINNANLFAAGTLQLRGQTSGNVNCYSTGTGAGGTVSQERVDVLGHASADGAAQHGNRAVGHHHPDLGRDGQRNRGDRLVALVRGR